MAEHQVFAVAAPGRITVVFLTVMILSVPVVGLLAMAISGEPLDAPLLVIVLGTPVVLGALLGFVFKLRGVELQGQVLKIRATMFSKSIAVDQLDLDRARIVSIAERIEYRPLLRIGGFSLPGFHAGHYRLKDLKKAFCLLAGKERVLVLPEKSGSVILLSLEKPQLLLEALKSTLAR